MSSRSCNYTSLDVTQGVQVVMPVEVPIFLLSSVHTRARFPRWSTGSLYSYSLTASITWTDCNSLNLNSCFFMAKQKDEQPLLHNLRCITCLPITTLIPITITFSEVVAKYKPKIYHNKK